MKALVLPEDHLPGGELTREDYLAKFLFILVRLRVRRSGALNPLLALLAELAREDAARGVLPASPRPRLRAAKPCTVYGLHSTRDRRVRYIGRADGDLKARLSRHLRRVELLGIRRGERGGHPRDLWIAAELDAGYQIEIVPLIENAVRADETRMIHEYLERGEPLTNVIGRKRPLL